MPSCALNRRDPPNGKNGFSTTKGFTVIEMMMALAVLAIITALALPSYREIIEKRRVTSAAEQIMTFLSSAQMESVKRNQYVAVNFEFNDGDWCLGMSDGDQPNESCDCTITDISDPQACVLDARDDSVENAQLRVLRYSSFNYPEVLLNTDTWDLVFDPIRGLVQDAESATIELVSPDQTTFALNVELKPTGRVSICYPDRPGSPSVSGFGQCEPKPPEAVAEGP